MSSPAIDANAAIGTNAAVDAAIKLTETLPDAGRGLVLAHLVSKLTREAISALPLGVRLEIIEALRPNDVLDVITFVARKKAFLDTYSVRVLGDHQVSLTIPAGKSRIDLINDAQDLVKAHYDRPGVDAHNLARWQNAPQFTEQVDKSAAVAIEGCVPESDGMFRSTQEARGWNDVDERDLATAHQAFLVATGKDLFNGMTVRHRGGTLGGTLRFGSSGLCACLLADVHEPYYVGVAASKKLKSNAAQEQVTPQEPRGDRPSYSLLFHLRS